MFGDKRESTNDVRVYEFGGDLKSEEAIIKEKARFGRVRNSLMKKLREQYGQSIADRAMWRVNARLSSHYLTGDDRMVKESEYLKTAKRLLPIKDLVDMDKGEMV